MENNHLGGLFLGRCQRGTRWTPAESAEPPHSTRHLIYRCILPGSLPYPPTPELEISRDLRRGTGPRGKVATSHLEEPPSENILHPTAFKSRTGALTEP